MSMDGLKTAPCIFRTPHIHVGRITQGARKAVRLYPWMDGISQGARKAVRLYPWMDGLKIAPCIFRTPHIHVGRIMQGARKAVRFRLNLTNFRYNLSSYLLFSLIFE